MAERTPLGTVANSRNHSVTAVLVTLSTGFMVKLFPDIAAVQWEILVAAAVGWLLGFIGSIWRAYMAASDGVSPATMIGKRLAQWVGCFAFAVLISGCAFESAKFNLAAADSEADTDQCFPCAPDQRTQILSALWQRPYEALYKQIVHIVPSRIEQPDAQPDHANCGG